MFRFFRVGRYNQYLFFLAISLFISFNYLIVKYQQYPITCEHGHSNLPNATHYERYCHQVDQRIKAETISNSSIQLDPRNESIPYLYSRWGSTPLLPRLITQCEHAIYMDLLSILIKHVFKKYNIQYMMMAATLLGSYTRHDLLPWDDDVDIRLSISDRFRFQSIIVKELSAKPYSLVLIEMRNKRNYDKVFFSWCPHFNRIPWRFPFIDIFYHDENSTHVWLLGQPSSCPVRREDIFPLVLRPLGSLWLYAPREPMAHFESRKMVQIEAGCYASTYSHKYERLMRENFLYVACSQLNFVYPYVIRRCTSHKCIEHLKFGTDIVIHKLIYNYAYRTFLYSETNSSYRAC